MDRQLIAYFLIALILAGAVGIALYLRHHDRGRTIARQRARDKIRREARSEAAKG